MFGQQITIWWPTVPHDTRQSKWIYWRETKIGSVVQHSSNVWPVWLWSRFLFFKHVQNFDQTKLANENNRIGERTLSFTWGEHGEMRALPQPERFRCANWFRCMKALHVIFCWYLCIVNVIVNRIMNSSASVSIKCNEWRRKPLLFLCSFRTRSNELIVKMSHNFYSTEIKRNEGMTHESIYASISIFVVGFVWIQFEKKKIQIKHRSQIIS